MKKLCHWSKALRVINLVILPVLSLFVHIVTFIIIFTLGWTLNPYPEVSTIICRVTDIIAIISLLLYFILRKRYVIIGGSYLACFGILYNLILLIQTMKRSVSMLIVEIAFSLLALFLVTTGNLVLMLFEWKEH